MTAESQQRSEYTAGLRALADLLDANPNIELPMTGQSYDPLQWVLTHDESQAETLATIARALPGQLSKSGNDEFFRLKGQIRGFYVKILADRDEVCTRRVVGTREVVETVPDPSVEVPLVERKRTEEIVEWDCGPILAPAGKAAE